MIGESNSEPVEVPLRRSDRVLHVGPHMVLSRLRRSRLRPRSKIHKVVMGFPGLVWALGRKAVNLSDLEVQRF